MDKEAATLLLKSSSPHERLRAARYFTRHIHPEHPSVLKDALHTETVSWVRRALSNAIDKASIARPEPEISEWLDAELSPATAREMHTRAMEEVCGTLLHEFQPIIGVLRLKAEQEVPNFRDSQVNRQLDRLDSLVAAIESLKRAAATPRPVQFDLAELVRNIVAEEAGGKKLGISLMGRDPMLTSADPDLLRLAISNGLRNAIDAVRAIRRDTEDHAIIVNWDSTDVEAWLAIIDKGAGVGEGSQGAFKIGTTTKKGHTGMGLPIARQAMDSMEGEISLSSGQDSGARFEVRWYL